MLRIIWDPSPGGNIEHIAEHGLTMADVDFVLENPLTRSISRSSGEPCVFGHTPDGRYIIVVYSQIDEDAVFPATAYDVPEPI